MNTPQFTLTQDENTLTINIYAPYCNLGELDISLDEDQFLFSCKPYYLRLTLPGSVVEDDRYKGTFDQNADKFSFTYGKKHPGEVFENLHLIPALLTPKVIVHCPEGAIPIEVNPEPQMAAAVNEQDEYAEYDAGDFRFGFGMLPKHSFGQVFSEFDDIFEVDPREVSVGERRKLRIQLEQGKFNVEHYLADFCDTATITTIISQSCPYEKNDIDSSFQFTEKEDQFLAEFDVVQQHLTYEQIIYGFHGLANLLFAYCYDKRINGYEECSESAWNINKLASTLCWFEGFRTPQANMIAAFRRSLIFPLYRNFDLSYRVFADLKALLNLPERHLTRALIDMYYMFQRSDKYILNKLFIEDYLIFVMKWDPEQWREVVQDYLELEVVKEDLGLNLRQIEEGYLLCPMLATMSLGNEEELDSDDCSSLSEYSSTDESTTSDDSI